MSKAEIYTKKGDQGDTGLFGTKERFPKSDLVFCVVGTIDEANSHLGLASSQIKEDFKHRKIIVNKIEQVQKNLFNLGAAVAGAKISISASVVTKFEKEIDNWQGVMPKLNNFILPGGGVVGAELFVARSVVRRLERDLVKLSKEVKIKPNLLVFVNRLSDYLFVLARYINFLEGRKESIWKK